MKNESLFSLVSLSLRNRNEGTFDSANPLYDLPSSYKRRPSFSVDRNSEKMWTSLDAALKKPFLLLWEKSNWQKISIWSGLVLPFNQNCFGLVTYKSKLQVCKSVLIEFAICKWQNIFPFANLYMYLPFRLFSW